MAKDKRYNSAPPKSPAGIRMVPRKGVRSSYAHQEGSFSKAHPGEREKYGEYGGDRGDALFGGGPPRLGQGKVGTDKHHGGAKAVDNIRPPSACDNASFSGVGGSPPKHTLG